MDKKDAHILQYLDFDARKNISSIAKEVSLSKQSISRRIGKLEKEGIIAGYYAVINFQELGFHYCRALVRLQYLDLKTRNKLTNYAKNDPRMNWVYWTDGEYDFCFGVWASTLSEFKEVLDDFKFTFSNNIVSIRTSFATYLEHLPCRFLTHSNDYRSVTFKERANKIQLEETDKRILRYISTNARASLLEIATHCKLNYKVVAYRMKSLQKRNVLLTTRADIDYKKLGYIHYKIIFKLNLRAGKEAMDKMRAFCKGHENVIYLENIVEENDFEIECVFESKFDFSSFMDTLMERSSHTIRDYSHITFESLIKVSFVPTKL